MQQHAYTLLLAPNALTQDGIFPLRHHCFYCRMIGACTWGRLMSIQKTSFTLWTLHNFIMYSVSLWISKTAADVIFLLDWSRREKWALWAQLWFVDRLVFAVNLQQIFSPHKPSCWSLVQDSVRCLVKVFCMLVFDHEKQTVLDLDWATAGFLLAKLGLVFVYLFAYFWLRHHPFLSCFLSFFPFFFL